MEDKLINCTNCKFCSIKEEYGNTHYTCLKNNKTAYPKQGGLLEDYPLSMRNCYEEKNKDGKDTNKRSY